MDEQSTGTKTDPESTFTPSSTYTLKVYSHPQTRYRWCWWEWVKVRATMFFIQTHIINSTDGVGGCEDVAVSVGYGSGCVGG